VARAQFSSEVFARSATAGQRHALDLMRGVSGRPQAVLRQQTLSVNGRDPTGLAWTPERFSPVRLGPGLGELDRMLEELQLTMYLSVTPASIADALERAF
jgi:hypothetical protein